MGFLLGACVSGEGSIGPRELEPLTLDAWCAAQPADRCVEALTFLHGTPEQEGCVVAVVDPERPFSELCAPPPPLLADEPVTTIPTPEQIAAMERQQAAEEAAHRLFVEEELPRLDERIAATLARTHPTGEVTVGLVLSEPMTVPDMEALMAELGGEWVSAWRTDYVCLPGYDGLPMPEARRFAYRNGVERAATARQAAEESDEPLVAHHIPYNAWAHMEQAARAIREPGVLVEAVEGRLPIVALPNLDAQPDVRTVRIAFTPEQAGDLSDPPVPDCELPVS